MSDTQQDYLSLIGTLISFFLFLLLLPSWIKFRWKELKFSNSIGLIYLINRNTVKIFYRGIGYAFGLISLVLIVLTFGSWMQWVGRFSAGTLLNAVSLGFGVGFAEELIFRVWLLGEMNKLVGSRWAALSQAVIFSLAHAKFNVGLGSFLSFHFGLFLLGFVLSQRRIIDGGSIWGCIGLHGGLVGMWFLIDVDLVNFSSHAPIWLIGPGGVTPNPIGGVVAIVALIMILLSQRTAVAIAGRPFSGAFKASSRGARP